MLAQCAYPGKRDGWCCLAPIVVTGGGRVWYTLQCSEQCHMRHFVLHLILAISCVQRSTNSEKETACSKKTKNELQSLSSRAYLERTVVPVVMNGMSVLAKERLETNTV